ncbi:peptide-methionine (S)-S-oxide reductase MsrA [Ensifer adhaerens]|uniref:peptide-methionine (S)-S-oxide reductase MsrA n=1 Tax=Ensifer adhaerens TaxID=106592 RepID=UPI00384BA67D
MGNKDLHGQKWSTATLYLLIAAAVVVGGLALSFAGETPAHKATRIPKPLHDIASTEPSQKAVLAGGCFWGVQAVFQHVVGVTSVTSGYAGGTAETATYELTETGKTDHAEAVEIKFDPKLISYGRLLEIYFSVAHDPTQLGGQGPDIGPQYRSVIFPRDEAQAAVALSYIRHLNASAVFDRPIVTTIERKKSFYPAEAYHQDYVYNNPSQAYVRLYEAPKIEALQRLYPTLYREKPILSVP